MISSEGASPAARRESSEAASEGASPAAHRRDAEAACAA